MHHPASGSATEKIAALDLIPGHAATTAEVWLWHGTVPEVSDDPRPWVVLSTDDWPMSADHARRLAAALVRAADRAESTAPGGSADAGPPRDDGSGAR